MSVSNAVLAEQVKRDDPHAFTQLFGRYHTLVYSVCLKLLGHREDAEDATQETFSRVARYLHRWDSDRPLEPWLIAIAGNRCRTTLSRRRPIQQLSNFGEGVVHHPSADPWSARHDEDTLREELSLAMKGLSPQHRIAFQMFHEQSLTYAQIAQRLNCPLGTAKTWVHRARNQLIESLIGRGVVTENRGVVTENRGVVTENAGVREASK